MYLILYAFLITVPLLHVSILKDRSTKAETYFAGICTPSIQFESKASDNSDCLVCQKRDQVVIDENIKRNARVRVADSLTMTRRRPPRSDSNWIYLLILLLWLVLPIKTGVVHSYADKQRYDGWYNNLAHPDWGSIDSRLIRKMPAAYSDGVYMLAGQDRPSPRKLSQLFMQGDDGLPSVKNRTALFAFFGQLVTSEIIMASESGCPIEYHRIDVDKCDPVFDKECQGNKYIPFRRADYDRQTGRSPNSPREQVADKQSDELDRW